MCSLPYFATSPLTKDITSSTEHTLLSGSLSREVIWQSVMRPCSKPTETNLSIEEVKGCPCTQYQEIGDMSPHPQDDFRWALNITAETALVKEEFSCVTAPWESLHQLPGLIHTAPCSEHPSAFHPCTTNSLAGPKAHSVAIRYPKPSLAVRAGFTRPCQFLTSLKGKLWSPV